VRNAQPVGVANGSRSDPVALFSGVAPFGLWSGALDRLVRRAPSRTLLFANTTGMREPVAAPASLTLMTCSRVNPATLGALRAFRARRIAFGQGFRRQRALR
jgi:hypothetical protein